ncbi:MAG: efflux RND transporter permease subunit, partial [Helicobacter sp.]|nr:efflux RND transporter permease subunit [Helicobacter sp.]
KTTASFYNGKEALSVFIKPNADANILDLTNQVEEVFLKINKDILSKEGLKLEWAYDQRDYIQQAITLVQKNIMIGGLLACCILLIFLRSFTSMLVIAVSMPLSIFGTFIIMAAFDRTLNVVSLAGISFAVGMLVDSSIVVLENIYRHTQMEKPVFQAIVDGTTEVIAGLIASVLTTIAIFIPILKMQEESGQLFRDIALATSSAVGFSLLVSIVIIPTLYYQANKFTQKLNHHPLTSLKFFDNLSNKLANFGNILIDWIMFVVYKCLKNSKNKILTIIGLTSLSLGVSYFLFPKAEYLPQGNQNFIFSILNPPPGLSYKERENIGKDIFECLAPYLAENGFQGTLATPPIDNIIYIGSQSNLFFGMRSTDITRAKDLIPIARACIDKIPGIKGVSNQIGIFDRRGGQGKNIDVDISGNNLESIIQTTKALQTIIAETFGEETQIIPRPSLELLYPEINLYPNSDKLKTVGLDARSFGIIIDVLMGGRKISEYKEEGREKIDLILKVKDFQINSPEDLYRSLIYTQDAGILPIHTLSELKLEYGMNDIRHSERNRTMSLQVNPPHNMTIEEAIDLLENQALSKLENDNALGDNKITLSGSADSLTKIRTALQGGFLLAIFIIYLLMAALYEDFIYPFIILFTIPLAIGGGILGLWLVDSFLAHQALDILTMLGFIILVGIVVNNAILIIYQALHN